MSEKDKKTLPIKKKDGKPTNPDKKKRKSVAQFLRETVNEVKKVTWPSGKEWINHTVVVTVFVIVMTVVVGLIDLGLSQLFALII